jgi:hypothetical protein
VLPVLTEKLTIGIYLGDRIDLNLALSLTVKADTNGAKIGDAKCAGVSSVVPQSFNVSNSYLCLSGCLYGDDYGVGHFIFFLSVCPTYANLQEFVPRRLGRRRGKEIPTLYPPRG